MDQEFAGRFWMVWNPQGRAPTVRHASQARADAEAERLARQFPGHVFIVLMALYGKSVRTPPPPPVITVPLSEIDLIPF